MKKTIYLLALVTVPVFMSFVSIEDKTVEDPCMTVGGEKCFLSVYAYVRSYSSKDDIWINNTKIFPTAPLSVDKPASGNCDDVFKDIKKQFVKAIKNKYKGKYQMTKSSVKIKSHSVFGNAEAYIKEIKRQASKTKERMIDMDYTYTAN